VECSNLLYQPHILDAKDTDVLDSTHQDSGAKILNNQEQQATNHIYADPDTIDVPIISNPAYSGFEKNALQSNPSYQSLEIVKTDQN